MPVVQHIVVKTLIILVSDEGIEVNILEKLHVYEFFSELSELSWGTPAL